MNPVTVINEAPMGRDWDGDSARAILDALAAAGFVVVACPPGEGRYVKRESKPCDECEGKGGDPRTCSYDDPASSFYGYPTLACEACGGSGVVEATTTYGLKFETWWRSGPPWHGRVTTNDDGYATPLFSLAAVALPEETPQ